MGNLQRFSKGNALQKFLLIKPKKYNYIDIISNGLNIKYGFIAQHVKNIIPEAISFSTEYIPNIYSICNINSNVITINNSNLCLNSNIKIYDINDKEINCKIIDINDNNITIDTYITGSNCFVYGIEINDFHNIDKDYIYTLNVSATKELYKKIQKQQKEIDTLNYKLNKLLEKLNITPN